MPIEDLEHDLEDDSGQKWKHRELGQRIRWTGPTLPAPWKGPALSEQSPLKALLNLAPTKAETEEHRHAWNEADNKYLEEQLRKLPLLAQHYGIHTQKDAWVGIVERNDVWVLELLLTLARVVVPGFQLDYGARRGARDWTEEAQIGLMADVEAVKYRWRADGRGKCSDRQACRILFQRPVYRPRYGDFYRAQSIDKRAISLNNRLAEARKKTIAGRLLAKFDGKIKQLLTDEIISLYGCDQSEAKAARARADAPEQMHPSPRRK
jgi:hypothetical protein